MLQIDLKCWKTVLLSELRLNLSKNLLNKNNNRWLFNKGTYMNIPKVYISHFTPCRLARCTYLRISNNLTWHFTSLWTEARALILFTPNADNTVNAHVKTWHIGYVKKFTFGKSRIWLASKKSSSKLLEYRNMSSGTFGKEQCRLSTHSTWRLHLNKGIHRNMLDTTLQTNYILIKH